MSSLVKTRRSSFAPFSTKHGEFYVSEPSLFLEPWTNIDTECITRYETLFQYTLDHEKERT